jgi:hypothetical protein
VNVRRAGPTVLAVFAVPAGKALGREATEQSLDLRRVQASNADIDGSGVGNSTDGPVSVMNIPPIHRMIDALRNPMRDRLAF